MKKILLLVSLILMMSMLCGCGSKRNVWQIKCDNNGESKTVIAETYKTNFSQGKFALSYWKNIAPSDTVANYLICDSINAKKIWVDR